ncbi:MAG: hypothetical protein AB3N16_08310, partial [Flavobacteriaceae bacterium]
GTGRQTDFDHVRLMVPGNPNYIDITADEILFNGFASTDASIRQNSPYACYADVTSIISALANPTGTYTVANVRSVVGSLFPGGGASAGWTMVIVYENPTVTGKLITTFDGFARVRGSNSVNINYSGFTTIPIGPVRANIGAAALEGDNRITGDQLRIRELATDPFVTLSNPVNPATNFFNSNITLNGAITTNRTPNSINTLGYDTDMFLMNNPSNNIIRNNATQATFQFRTNGDQYYPFFNSFNIEIIEPNIVLEKRVEDIGGNDITGAGVNLGQVLDYVLSFQNTGNDNAVNYTIRDVLPINVTLDEANMVLPPGVTYTYDAPTRTVVFSIPPHLVEEGDPTYNIRMRVQVAENCFDFIDACTDLIQNLAYSTYEGEINDNQITDDPSVSDFDDCGFVTPGATNFLLDDLENCNFTRTVQLCGAEVVLDAGDNFDDYIWVFDANENGQIDPSDPRLDDGNPDGDMSTMTVTDIGTYIVDKIVADPCKGFKEIIVVERFGSDRTHPVIEYYNQLNGDADPYNDLAGEIVTCSIDNDQMPKLFLCGTNDDQLIQVNIVDAQSISWEKLVEGSCSGADPGDDCANKDLSCNWNEVGTGDDYLIEEPGEYRLVVTYQNGCFNRFYFNVFLNDLDIQHTKRDIVCTTPGNITITNLGNSYGYQLVNIATNTIVVPFSANNGPSFDITANGAYRVEMMQLDGSGDPIPGSCIFQTDEIGILDRQMDIDVDATDALCNGFGSITIQVNNVFPNYEYEIRLDDGSNGGQGTLLDNETDQSDNDFTFDNLNPGDYIVIARTADGCEESEQVTIVDLNDLELQAVVTQQITCDPGTIEMNTTGGEAPYSYAIWEYVDGGGTTVISYATPQDIPATEFQGFGTFDILNPGDYTFIVIDNNNCFAHSNTVRIELRPEAVLNPPTITNVACFGDASGSIQMNLVNSNGYQITYYLFDATGFDPTNYDFTNALASNTSGVFPGLAAGDYVVVTNQISGDISCDQIEDITVSAPANALTAEAQLTQEYTCLQTGTIRAQNVSGGTAPYEYSIDGVNFASGAGADIFTGLTDGTYTITVRDANNCTFSPDPITIDPLNEPSDITFSATPPNCPALTSNVTLTIIDGNAPFSYEIIAPAADALNNGNNNTFAGLSPNTYTFRITDDKGCTYEKSHTISPVTQIAVSGNLENNITCAGADDGSILYTISGFATSYDYSVTGPTTSTGTAQTNTTLTLDSLAAGTYTITVTDTDTNCTDTASITVAAPPSTATISLDVTDLSCSATGTVPGSVTITANGGWGGYEYELESPTGAVTGPQGNNSFTGLTDTTGNYTVTVRDAGGCELTETFTLTPTVAPVLQATANSMCYDPAVGLTITATVTSGGTAPFQYNIDGGAYQSSNQFAGLTPGNYTIEVIDSRNCTDTATIEVFPSLTATASLDKGLDCTASPNATISVTVSGGNLPYTGFEVSTDNGTTWSASTAFTGSSFTHSAATSGTYTFRITDNETCTYTVSAVVAPITSPDITSLTQTANILCSGDENAAINIAVSSGVPPYTINVTNTTTGTNYGQQTTGLAAGNYTITVTDTNSCQDTANITITEPNVISYDIDLNPITCSTTTGTIPGSITVENLSGGTAEYTYHLTGNNGHSDTYTTTSGGEDHTFDILEFGIYEVDVVDANGCSVKTTNIIASPPDDLDIDVSTATANCATGGTAEVTVTTAILGTNYEFGILDSFAAPYSSNFLAPDVPGGATRTFTGLTPGITYTFVVHDITTNCFYFESANAPIDTPSNMTTALDQVNNVSCTGSDDGNVSFSLDDYDPGATSISYEVFNAQSNATTGTTGSVNVNPPAVGTGVSVTNVGPLSPGVYYILFTEVGGAVNGCTVASAQFTITESSNLLQVDATLVKNDNCHTNAGEVSAVGQHGTPPYEYQILPAAATAPTVATWAGSSTAFFNVEGGNYTVYIMDAFGCIQSDNVSVPTDSSPDISLAIVDECVDEGEFEIQVSLDATNTGIAPYRIRINGGAFQSIASLPHTFSQLASGSHTVEIQDANGCGDTENITISPQLSISASVVSQPTCATDDGVLSFTVSGGDGSHVVTLLNATTMVDTGLTPTGNQFTGVGFGDYIVRVTDSPVTASSCTAEAPISLEEPTAVTLLLPLSTNGSCNGASDGSITVRLQTPAAGVNDNPPYTYEITDGTTTITQSTNVFAGLAAGTYDITVTSNRDCEATQQVQITEPTALNATITDVTPFACDANNATEEASIEVTITTGTGTADYFYSVNGGAYIPTNGTVFTYSTPTPGNYDITIRDANSCTFTLPTQTITPLNNFVPSVAQVTAISCNGPEEVSISVSDDGNTHVYSFELLPVGNTNGTQTAVTDTSASYELSAPGSYVFRVTDTDTGCFVDTTPYVISPFDIMEVNAAALAGVSCFGGTDGSLSLTITDYNGTYDYEVFDGGGTSVTTGNGDTGSANPMEINGLSGGNYTVEGTQTNAPFCTQTTNTVTIPSPDRALTATVTPLRNVGCSNDLGEVSITPTGGTAPYDIVLTNTTNGSSQNVDNVFAVVFTALSEGSYTVAVTDANNCTWNGAETLTRPTPVSGNITASTTLLQCEGDTNASVTAVAVANGSGNYEYILNIHDGSGAIEFTSAEQLSPTYDNLGAGTYSITITDGWNCDFTTPTVTIDEPSTTMASLIRTSALTCETQAELELSASGGTPPYQYSEDGTNFFAMAGGDTHTFTVDAGTYQYWVRDANGCEAVLSNAVTEDPIVPMDIQIDTSLAMVQCNGESTAVITAEASGGLGNYSYELYQNGQVAPIQGPQTNGEFRNLLIGQYTVRATSEDCEITSGAITITEPTPLDYTDNITHVSCFGEEDGSITVELSGGAGDYIYAISPNLDQFDTENTFDELAAGDYTIIAQDQNGCFLVLDYTIGTPDLLTVTGTGMPEICTGSEDGSISLDILGGTPPYRSALNSNADADFVQDRIEFTNLAAGDYVIIVRDANDCEANTVVTVGEGVNLNATVTPVYECSGTVPNNYVNITLEDESVLGSIMYGLDSTESSAMQLNPDFRDMAPGNHYIAIAHANGCMRTFHFEIADFEELAISAEQQNLNEITATASGGVPEYTYYFNDENYGGDNTYRITETGTYQVRVMDHNGCEATTEI